MNMLQAIQLAGLLMAASLALIFPTDLPAAGCGDRGIQLQVLGSGGPELDDQRASSGYLVWQDGRGRVLIDLGPGSLLQYERSAARLADLDVVLLTHLHVDHSADLPALIKGSFFTDRSRDLPLYGPTGNDLMPATSAFVRALFATPDGAYRYLSDYLDGSGDYRLLAHDVPADDREPHSVFDRDGLRLTAIPVHHGPVAALAWRVDVDGRSLVISGDMNGDWHTLERLAAGADLLVAHHAIPEGATGVARNLHMPPSVIGAIAGQARVKQLVLSHRMRRTLGRETDATREIRQRYAGPLSFAEDGQCFAVSPPD
jgi:ribonuclease BN (tRNA processing enzyme)